MQIAGNRHRNRHRHKHKPTRVPNLIDSRIGGFGSPVLPPVLLPVLPCPSRRLLEYGLDEARRSDIRQVQNAELGRGACWLHMSAQSRSASSSSGCTGDQWKSLFIGSRVCAPCSTLDVELRLLCSRINGTELVRIPVAATLQLCNSATQTQQPSTLSGRFHGPAPPLVWPKVGFVPESYRNRPMKSKVGGNRPVHAMLWVQFSRRNETKRRWQLVVFAL